MIEPKVRGKQPKVVWLVYRDAHIAMPSGSDYTTHELHSVWSTQPLAKAKLVELAQRHNVKLDVAVTETGLFKTPIGYAGFTVTYAEVDRL